MDDYCNKVCTIDIDNNNNIYIYYILYYYIGILKGYPVKYRYLGYIKKKLSFWKNAYPVERNVVVSSV